MRHVQQRDVQHIGGRNSINMGIISPLLFKWEHQKKGEDFVTQSLSYVHLVFVTESKLNPRGSEPVCLVSALLKTVPGTGSLNE